MKKKNIVIIVMGVVIFILLSIIAVFIFTKVDNNEYKENNINKNEVTEIQNQGYTIKDSKTKSIKLVDYENNELTMKIPEGFKVETTGEGMYYVLKVYDPQDERNQIFSILKAQPFLKSQKSKDFWKSYSSLYGANSQYRLFADAIVLQNPTVEGFYKKFPDYVKYAKSIEPLYSTFDFPELNNFKKLEEFQANSSMKSVAKDDKILRATFNTDEKKEGEGLFMASIVNFGDYYMNGIDTMYYMIYNIMGITSIKNEMINYEEILTKSLNTLEFKKSYVQKTIDDGNKRTKQALALNAQVQAAFDSYCRSWENRQKSYDITSQKYSDATLGYERVYDTETGDIYKAYNGFTDDYNGSRYQTITDDMYTKAITGYIEK